MPMEFKYVQELVFFLLRNAAKFKWSLQGFGMLRLHLPGGLRLNVWDSRYRVKDVSVMHTHPWFFTSLIVSGNLLNTRYVEMDHGAARYHFATIKPGQGGGLMRDLGLISLVPKQPERYCEGMEYRQEPDEIHVSSPEDGCITLNYRIRTGEDVATVYWPYGTSWVSAEPKTATPEEVEEICGAALRRLSR